MVLVGNAQQGIDIDSGFLTQSDILANELSSDENFISVDQIGNNNQVEIIQRRRLAENNLTRIKQQGSDNFAQVLQFGGNNQVILLQKGSENEFQLDLSGTSNDIAVVQNGNRNEIRQTLTNARTVSVDFVQNGDGNLIEHQADGLISKDFKVLQSGNNMRVRIDQSSVALPPVRQ